VQALPDPLRDAANESVSGTYAVAERMGATGTGLIGAANEAFVGAMHWASASGAVVALLGAAVVLRWLPGRAAAEAAGLVGTSPGGDVAMPAGATDEPAQGAARNRAGEQSLRVGGPRGRAGTGQLDGARPSAGRDRPAGEPDVLRVP
jgi:hypothetical protein